MDLDKETREPGRSRKFIPIETDELQVMGLILKMRITTATTFICYLHVQYNKILVLRGKPSTTRR